MLTAEDRLAINDLCTRYVNAIDLEQVEQLADYFTEDGVYEFGTFGRYTGRAAIAAEFTDFIEKLGRAKRHILANLQIDDGEQENTAYLRSYLLIADRDSGPVLVATAVWTDVVRKTASGWLFTSRRMEVDPAFTVNGYGKGYAITSKTVT